MQPCFWCCIADSVMVPFEDGSMTESGTFLPPLLVLLSSLALRRSDSPRLLSLFSFWGFLNHILESFVLRIWTKEGKKDLDGEMKPRGAGDRWRGQEDGESSRSRVWLQRHPGHLVIQPIDGHHHRHDVAMLSLWSIKRRLGCIL